MLRSNVCNLHEFQERSQLLLEGSVLSHPKVSKLSPYMTTFGGVNIWVCRIEDLAACSTPGPWYTRIEHQTSKYSKAVVKQISPLHFIFHFKIKRIHKLGIFYDSETCLVVNQGLI